MDETGTVVVPRDAIAPWRPLLRLGTVSAIVVVVMIPSRRRSSSSAPADDG